MSKSDDASMSPNGNHRIRKKKMQLLKLEKMRKGGFWFRRWSFQDVTTLCWIIGVHVLAAWSPFVFDWGAYMVAVRLALLTGLGMTIVYHRLLTHQSFKIPKGLEYTLAYYGALAGQICICVDSGIWNVDLADGSLLRIIGSTRWASAGLLFFVAVKAQCLLG